MANHMEPWKGKDSLVCYVTQEVSGFHCHSSCFFDLGPTMYRKSFLPASQWVSLTRKDAQTIAHSDFRKLEHQFHLLNRKDTPEEEKDTYVEDEICFT
jgi:hypothetical protein